VAAIIHPLGKEIQDLCHGVHIKKTVIQKMEEEVDFIPHSARVKLELTYTDVAIKKFKPERKTALDNRMCPNISIICQEDNH
jgi:hypothetical protein